MEYLGKAYAHAGVKPGDVVTIKSIRTNCPDMDYPNGAKVIGPHEARSLTSCLSGNADKYVYVTEKDGIPETSNGYDPFIFCITRIGGSPSGTKEEMTLKERNDSGGNDGKCVACNAELKAWSWNKFYCPVCEP